jgi:hypothetical protein
MIPPPHRPHMPHPARPAHSPHGAYRSLSGQQPPSAHAYPPIAPCTPIPTASRTPDRAVGGAGAAGHAAQENGPATYTETSTPYRGAYAPGPATLCLALAALALLAAAAFAADAAPAALRLLAVLNLPAALRTLGPSLLCAATGVAAATSALLLASFARSATLDAESGLPQADGRTWAVLRLERALHDRRRHRWVEG